MAVERDLPLLSFPGGGVVSAVASSVGVATLNAASESESLSDANADGNAVITGFPAVRATSAGGSFATAASLLSSQSVGNASGVSFTAVFGSGLKISAGSAAGIAAGVFTAGGPSVGASASAASATAVGRSTRRANAAAGGLGIAAAVGSFVFGSPRAAAAGNSTAAFIGRKIAAAIGFSGGITISSAVGTAIRPPRPASIDIRERAESVAVGVTVEMYEVDAAALGGPIFRFCNAAVQNDLIRFAGESYAPLQFETDGWASSGSGPITRPTLRMNSTISVLTACADLDDLRGAYVRRIRTLSEYLDDGATPDPSQRFPDELYVVSRITNKDLIFVEFELMALIDQEGKQLPSRQAFRTRCSWIYRRYDAFADISDPFNYENTTCPYQGQLYMTKTDEITQDPSKDVCSKRLVACKARFGANTVLPYGGFPGMVRV